MTDTGTAAVHPERQKRVRTALNLFSIAAWVTGVWLLLLCTALVLHYGFHINSLKTIVGQVHGLFYMLYLLAVLNLATKARWSPQKSLISALWGTVPFMSFVNEHKRRQEVIAQFHLKDAPAA